MRIGFDLRRLDKTGIGRYAANLLAAVAAEDASLELVVVVNDERHTARANALAPRARTAVCPARQYTLREMAAMPKIGSVVDLWHSPHPYHLSLRAGQRTVLTLLDLIQLRHPIGVVNQAARYPLRMLLAAACRNAAQFIAISAATRAVFQETLGVCPDMVQLAPPAPDPLFTRPVSPDDISRTFARWRLTEPVILYVGMAQPHKNLERLLEGARQLHADDPNQPWHLVLAGPLSPTQGRRLHSLVRRMHLSHRIRHLGWLSDLELRTAYHGAHMLVLPSLEEGFGLTLLEAMQCGTACVAADIPALREAAGDAAHWIDPLDAQDIAAGLHAVLHGGDLRSRLIGRGYANVQRYSWASTARATLVAYRNALG